MVVRPTLENLRARPKDEKTAIAAGAAIAIVAILFVAWLIYFFHSIQNTPAPDLQSVGDSLNQNGLQQADQQFQQAYGSTTQFVDLEGNEQVQPVSTSTQ